MPDHVHVLLTPAPDVSLEKTVQFIKGGFSFRLKSKAAFWDRGHFDRRIADREAYEACCVYIAQNPVRARICAEAASYPYLSSSMPDQLDPRPAWF